ncbi:hypothetical protein IFM12275_14710 [Nocardia sputorum]|uniref:hypothetical protein n=1 Tax=Nocardia sputorum TaxID=2984338 RepID=UPI002492D93F|nr:hypothetical protein [Nocardia sputorum]BDT91495.1 hypothetical protein IFM12275_14710 [Nocardia sputorum]
MSDTEIALEATGLRYGSPFDEAAFFEWLDKIPAVRSYEGELRTLYIKVDATADDESVYELVSLFHRYHVDMSQLRVFDTERIGEWFRKPESYWHEFVFGPSS